MSLTFKGHLFQWNDPLSLALSLSPKDFDNDWQLASIGKYKKHREAWVLSRFAAGYQRYFKVITQVKMIDDREQSPDGLMKISSKEIPFDVTIVLDPNRRMALEIEEAYKNTRKEVQVADSRRYPSKLEVLSWLKNRLNEKKRGAYPGLHLLIYLNAWHQELDYRDLAPLAREANAWSDVWIVCSSGLDEQYALTAITNNTIAGWFKFQLIDSCMA